MGFFWKAICVVAGQNASKKGDLQPGLSGIQVGTELRNI